MTKREILTDALLLFGGWGIVFFGVLATPIDIIPLSYKVALSLLDTLAFIIIGIIYFRWEKVALIKPTLFFWFFILGELFIVVSYAYAATINLQPFSFDGVAIVTYNNLLCGLFYGIALFSAYDLGRRLVKRYKERSKG